MASPYAPAIVESMAGSNSLMAGPMWNSVVATHPPVATVPWVGATRCEGALTNPTHERSQVTSTTSDASYRATYAVLALGVASYALLQSMVIPVLPTIQHGLHSSQSSVTWVLTAYLLSASVFTPLFGRIGDLVGKEKTFVLSLLALGIGSLIAALAPSVGVMIAARAVQGIGGGVLPLSFGIVRDEFPAHRVAQSVGTMAALTAVGSGLGIVLAGPIVETLGYHWLFWLPTISTSIAATAARVVIPASPTRASGRISWIGAATLSVWLVALLVGVSQASTWGWLSTKVLGLFGLSAAVFVAWIAVELRAAHPLIDMHMMRIPAVWTLNLVALLFGIGMYATFGFLPEFLQTRPSAGYGFGVTVTVSGLILLPMTAMMAIFGVASGRLSARFGAKRVLTVGTVVTIAPFVVLVASPSREWAIAAGMGLLGIGFGLAFAAMSALIVHAVPPDQTGVASGMNANIRTIGGSIGAAVMASIVTAGVSSGRLPSAGAYQRGFAVLGAAMLAATIAAGAVPGAKRRILTRQTSGQIPAELATMADGGR